MYSSPRWQWLISAARLDCVPLGKKSAASSAEQRGGALLQAEHRRVVAEDVVADLGRRHRGAHRRTGPGDGVAAEIDHRSACSRLLKSSVHTDTFAGTSIGAARPASSGRSKSFGSAVTRTKSVIE